MIGLRLWSLDTMFFKFPSDEIYQLIQKRSPIVLQLFYDKMQTCELTWHLHLFSESKQSVLQQEVTNVAGSKV